MKCIRELTRGYRVTDAIKNGTPLPTCGKSASPGTEYCNKCHEMIKHKEMKKIQKKKHLDEMANVDKWIDIVMEEVGKIKEQNEKIDKNDAFNIARKNMEDEGKITKKLIEKQREKIIEMELKMREEETRKRNEITQKLYKKRIEMENLEKMKELEELKRNVDEILDTTDARMSMRNMPDFDDEVFRKKKPSLFKTVSNMFSRRNGYSKLKND